MLNDIGQVGLTVKADVFHGVTEACPDPHTLWLHFRRRRAEQKATG
jgi:hypothetical protein